MSNDFKRMEVMTGDVRRRRWTTEQKLTIIEQSLSRARRCRPPVAETPNGGVTRGWSFDKDWIGTDLKGKY